MPNGIPLLSFVVAALVLLVTPGPGVLYVVARSIEQGRRAGLLSVLGLSVGALVHVVAAAVGLSALLLASATAFGVVKLLGAGYLIYLGVRTLLPGRTTAETASAARRSVRRLFRDGVIVSVTNPKIAVFFLAFLPQFVDPASGPLPRQIVLLGLIYVALALVTDSAYALLAGTIRGRLDGRSLYAPLTRYVTASVYLGLGITTAVTGRRA